MFIIRRAQMDALAAVALKGFEARLATWLVSTEPERCGELGRDGLRRLIHEGVLKAKGYGIESEQDVAEFVTLLVQRGPDFDVTGEHAWAGEIFARKGVPAAIRLERVKTRLAASARRSNDARGQ